MAGKPKWQKEEVERVLALIVQGLSLEDIAERFSKSRNALVGLWYRLRKGGVYPELAEAVAKAEAAMRAHKPHSRRGRKRKKQTVERRKTQAERKVPNKPVCVMATEQQARKLKYPPFKKPLVPTGDPRQEPPNMHQCAFIENDEETWWYCKELTRLGSSYCDMHHEVVYVSTKRGAREAQDHEVAQGA